MRLIPIVFSFFFLGCASIGVECKTDGINAWAKMRPFFGVSNSSVESMAMFRDKICR